MKIESRKRNHRGFQRERERERKREERDVVESRTHCEVMEKVYKSMSNSDILLLSW